jgi:hypothetical protein
MNADVVFVRPTRAGDWDHEHELKAAFTVTGPKGLVVLLTEGLTPTDYEDVESVA